jgi:hypothetical protein
MVSQAPAYAQSGAFPIRFATSERNFWRASLLVVGLVLVFEIAFWVWANLFPTSGLPVGAKELLSIASETAMRYVALPHFIIGFMFMVTAAKNRNGKRRLLIAGLLLLSVMICVTFRTLQDFVPTAGLYSDRYFVRTGTNLVMMFPIVLYFLVHELRDQAFFYTLNGEMPSVPSKARFNRFVRHLIAFTLATILVAIWTLILFAQVKVFPIVPAATPLSARIWMAGLPIALLLLAAYLIARCYVHGSSWSVSDVFIQHAPLLRVFAGVVLWLVIGLITRTGVFVVNTLHVAGWYVFTCYMLTKRPPKAPPQSWWAWLRTTLPGFRVLHIGLVVGMLAVAGLWSYAFGQEGWLPWALSPRTFYYWTIIHITASFVPR